MLYSRLEMDLCIQVWQHRQYGDPHASHRSALVKPHPIRLCYRGGSGDNVHDPWNGIRCTHHLETLQLATKSYSLCFPFHSSSGCIHTLDLQPMSNTTCLRNRVFPLVRHQSKILLPMVPLAKLSTNGLRPAFTNRRAVMSVVSLITNRCIELL